MRRKKGIGSIAVVMVFLGIIGGVVFLYNAPMFEREAPKITLENNGYWNMRDPLTLKIEDGSGIRSYGVTLTIGDETVELGTPLMAPQPSLSQSLEMPKRLMAKKADTVTVNVRAVDGSRWNFFGGNEAETAVTLTVDKSRPRVSTIAHSYSINKGGSALVIFKAEDENLQSLEIETSYGKTFTPQPFMKEGFYISLVAWPVMQSDFRATVVATDKAGNVTRSPIPYYLIDKKYRTSNITLKDAFLDGKIAELSEIYPETQGVTERIAQFKIINEDVRANNEKKIHDVTSRVNTDTTVEHFAIQPFYPLKNGKKVADFGDHRYYFYNGAQVSDAYHLGLDLASVKMGPIKSQNNAVTVFAEENGIYGNLPILYHGLGLYSIYGHCSGMNVQPGDQVHPNQQIGNTGLSGYAMGDHLHFGILVQGIEVRPEEWMDTQWIRLNITDVIKSAKQVIARQ